jgi:hypothetical protein
MTTTFTILSYGVSKIDEFAERLLYFAAGKIGLTCLVENTVHP